MNKNPVFPTGDGIWSDDRGDKRRKICYHVRSWDPETQITLVQGCDDLCRMCPNQGSGVCTSLEKVAIMDSAVLRSCDLACGEALPWARAADKARERIFDTEEFQNICACCQWFSLYRRTEVCHESHT